MGQGPSSHRRPGYLLSPWYPEGQCSPGPRSLLEAFKAKCEEAGWGRGLLRIQAAPILCREPP